MEKDSVISVHLVCKSYRAHKVLNRLDLEIKKGEIFGITGVSGAGKTTLLNVLAGFLRIDSGEIFYSPDIMGEKNIKPLLLRKFGGKLKPYVGYATQEPSFYEELKVTENLDFFGAMYNIPKEVRKKNVEILIQLMGLEDVKKKIAKSLSGGMRKRLDIACALIHNPKILFLDEPTSDLDPILRRKVWSLMKQLNDQGTTIIISSHFLNEIEELCDRIGILHKGVIINIIKKHHKGEIGGMWLDIIIKPNKNEELLGELLKGNHIKPEDVAHDKELLIRTDDPEKLKSAIEKSCKTLDVELSKCNQTKKTFREIFETTVK